MSRLGLGQISQDFFLGIDRQFQDFPVNFYTFRVCPELPWSSYLGKLPRLGHGHQSVRDKHIPMRGILLMVG